ncbi:MAG: primosomal protein N' [Muribaculaceae bacterium]|nr:primosomal protein N' [Muribaculaceae bacterium]
MMKFAEVILPLPLYSTYTYSVPESMAETLRVGSRVIVPFGLKKFYTGIVSALTPIRPEGYELKEIIQILDDSPIVKHPQLKFWDWIAEYYLCGIGDVYKAALPAGLKIESETFVELVPDFATDLPMSERETIICQLLDHEGRLSVADVEKKSGLRLTGALISGLIERGAVTVSEKLVERYRSRRETYVRLTARHGDMNALQQAFASVAGAKKQETMLLALVDMAEFTRHGISGKEVSRSQLVERSGCSTAILSVLVKKGIVETYTKEINRFRSTVSQPSAPPALSEPQQRALNDIHSSFNDHSTVLLHGVTASGKTEIYIHLIDYVLHQGNQVLYLVPEIALTTQLTRRLQKVFGDRVVIYHSKFSDNERVDIWRRMLRSSEPCVVIGARSSVFLPFTRLGMVIVDEEHETSYKQFDPAPRYNARDAALVLASMHGAKTLLGSATPSVETYYKAKSQRYGLVELNERYGKVEMPLIEIIDMLKERQRRSVDGLMADETTRLANEAIRRGEQVILFHNRRGFAPLARCRQCAYIPKCDACDVSLTYHRHINKLVCHYCGATYELPSVCPACKEPAVEILGYGTERIEDLVQTKFPEARILRMDLDTTRNKDGYENIINDFSARKSDILVGTQMVTKGLDFAGVSMVGVLNADTIINFPDFRSAERSFNMLMQVAGRAGRSSQRGLVAVQTSQPDHPVIKFLTDDDYTGFYNHELEERRRYNYPPFTRLINIYLKHRSAENVNIISEIYGRRLRELFGTRVFGPEEPSIGRIQSLYIRKIMLKVETQASMQKVRNILRSLLEQMHTLPQMKGTIVYYDVDPL